MKRKLIPNKDLVLEKIPNPDDKSSDYKETWMGFALTMNAYEVCATLILLLRQGVKYSSIRSKLL